MDFEIAKELINLLGNDTDSAFWGVIVYFALTFTISLLQVTLCGGVALGGYKLIRHAFKNHSFSYRISKAMGYDYIPSYDYEREREKMITRLYVMQQRYDDVDASYNKPAKATTGPSTGSPGGVIIDV
jgi:hypothetical protein